MTSMLEATAIDTQSGNSNAATDAKAAVKAVHGYVVPDVPSENERLDTLHDAFREYMNGRLSLAPLEEFKPQAILELGSGSGQWAIQAASQFPEAHVTAVDLRPIPRALPPNLEMRILNLVDPLPFQEESFDIIHARFVFIHLPNAYEVLTRVIKLLKPGGWLLVEEIDITEFTNPGPVTSQALKMVKDMMENRGISFPPIRCDSICLATGLFSEVQSRKATLYISEQGEDASLNRLGAVYRSTLLDIFALMPDRTPGATKELIQLCQAEMNDPQRDSMSTNWFTWAQKK